jgi:Zn-finger nucleic acid-binding protein
VNKKIIKKKRIHENAKIVPEGERKCPICGEIMYLEKLKGISTDVCKEHGIWMDKGEFTKITKMIKAKMVLDKTIAVKHAKLEGKASGSILGVWSFLFN